jgi:hypothetical protein
MHTLALWGLLPFLSGQPAFSPPMPRQGQLPGPGAGQPAAERPAPSTETPPAAPLMQFDPESIRVDWRDRTWQLTAKGQTLKNFGGKQHDARQAYRLIHRLNLTERGTVGGENPVLEYWLSKGQPPHTTPPGLRLVPFDPETLRVETMQSQWVLRDSRQVLFNFVGEAEDAQQAYQVIKRYGFNQVALVGLAKPSMMVFVKDQARTKSRESSARKSQPLQVSTPLDRTRTRFPGAGIDRVITAAIPFLDDAEHPSRRERLQLTAPGPLPGFPSPSRQGANPNAPRPFPTLPQLVDSRLAAPANGFPATTALPQRLYFDWRNASLRQREGNWELIASNLTLAQFGRDEASARLALKTLKQFQLTEQVRYPETDPLGFPPPSASRSGDELPPGFSFYLVHGKAPRGQLPHLDGRTFRPATVWVRRVGRDWVVYSNDGILMSCGSNLNRARHVSETIRRYQFDHMYHIGSTREGRGMTFLARVR